MKNAGVAVAKARLSSLLDAVEAGQEVTITRRGKPVARLIAVSAPLQASARFDLAGLKAYVIAGGVAKRSKRTTAVADARARSALMVYLDTSVLGALFFRQPGAVRIADRLKRARGPLLLSSWTLTEMASVAAIKERSGEVDLAAKGAALSAFQQFVSDSMEVREVDPLDFRTAATLLEPAVLGLRAGDALHLAVARRAGADLATLDRRQASAALHHRIRLYALT